MNIQPSGELRGKKKGMNRFTFSEFTDSLLLAFSASFSSPDNCTKKLEQFSNRSQMVSEEALERMKEQFFEGKYKIHIHYLITKNSEKAKFF